METIDLISLISSIASLVLAIVAIYLSIVFYRFSDQATQKTVESANNIRSSVEKLEKIFDKLYADTFSMMRETVTDMRNHVWKAPNNNADKIKDQEIALENKIKDILKETGIDENEKIKEITGKFEEIIRDIEKRNITIEDDMISMKMIDTISLYEPIEFSKFLQIMESLGDPFREDKIVRTLFSLRESKKITWEGSPNTLNQRTKIKISL